MSHLGDEIAALVDGELSHDARDRALAHLATCTDCRSLVDAERRTKATIRGLDVPPPPADLTASLLGLPAELRAPRGLRAGSVWLAEHRPQRRRRNARGPADGRPHGGSRRSRRRVSAMASGVVLVGVAAAAFAVGGGPSGERPVRPQMDRFSVEHAAVTPEVPLTDQGDPAVVVSFPLPTPSP